MQSKWVSSRREITASEAEPVMQFTSIRQLQL